MIDAATLNSAVQDAAFDWLAELNSGGPVPPDRQSAFQAWLDADAAHASAFAQAQALWRDLDWADALNAAALETGSVPSLPPRSPPRRPQAGRPQARRPLRVAAWAAAAAAMVAMVVTGPDLYRIVADAVSIQVPETTTRPGEIRRIVLSDGSAVTLGGRSSLRVRMMRDRREVELVDGDAYFEVAADPGRPFTVTTGALTATAVGTAFEVNHTRRAVQVAVTEGHVRAAARGETATLAVGQRARLTPNGPFAVEAFDLSTAGRWRDQRAAFRDAPLGEVVETLDRYHPAGVVLADPTLADLPVSAAFRFEQMEVALNAVAANHDLEVRRDPGGRLVIDRIR